MLSFNQKEVQNFVTTIGETEKKKAVSSAKTLLAKAYKESFAICKARYPQIKKSTSSVMLSFASSVTKKYKVVSATKLEVTIKAATKPVSMINLVVGSKEPRTQKGIAVTSRPKIYMNIAGHRKTLGPRQFIAAPKNASQVFHVKQGKWRKLTYSSLYDVLLFRENQQALVRLATKEVNGSL